MRSYYKGTVRDEFGSIIASATVHVYLAGTNTAADIYTASSGGVHVHYVTAGADGVFFLYVDSTDYDASQLFKFIVASGSYNRTYDTMMLFGLDYTYPAESILANATSSTAVLTALTLSEQTVLGRITDGHIVGLTPDQIRTLINVADGSTANEKASAEEVLAGTDDTKFVTPLGITPILPNRNVIINGAMDIWQRGTTSALGGLAYESADRWKQASGDNVGVISRATDAPDGFTYSQKLIRTVGSTGTTNMYVNTCLESIDSRKLAGKTVTLSFYAKVGADFSPDYSAIAARISTGTGTDESYGIKFPTGNIDIDNYAVLTTNWVRYSYSMTLDADMNQIGLMFYYMPVGIAGADDSFYYTGVQIELGAVATPFEFRHYAQELALCQRYCYGVTTAVAAETIGFGYSTSDTIAYINISLPVEMREVPILVATAAAWRIDDIVGSSVDLSAIVVGEVIISRKNFVVLKCTVASGLTENTPAWLVGDGTAGRKLLLTAEL